MKTIVEKPLSNYFVTDFYVRILNICMNAVDEDTLRRNMKTVFDSDTIFSKYFDYGFGHNHMWVHEHGNNNRLIVVEF